MRNNQSRGRFNSNYQPYYAIQRKNNHRNSRNNSNYISEDNFNANDSKPSEKEVKQWKLSNRIGWWSVGVNAFLGIVTVLALVIAWDSLNTTKLTIIDSDKQFDKTLTQIKRSTRATELSAKSLEGSNKISQGNYELAKKVLDIQIASLKNSNELFTKEHEPYLEVGDIDNLNIDVKSKFIKFNFKSYNLGKEAVRGISSVQAGWADTLNNIENEFNDHVDILSKNVEKTQRYFYSKDLNKAEIFTISSPFISGKLREKFYKGILTIYFIGRYKYYNFINKKQREYTYLLSIKCGIDGKINYAYLHNENKDM
jgi:membrane protein YqaA with SNARE-associated domain